MITKNDCILLLSELKENGINITSQLTEALKNTYPSVEVLKFINDNRLLDVTAFYEKIRKSYNNKKSSLYINIVKENIEDPTTVLTTLSAMLTLILLYSKTIEDKPMFLRHSRAEEISKVLTNYFRTYDLQPCIKLLSLIKADIKTLEYINGRV